MPENETRLSSGTTTLAFHYKGGVILAADRRVTAGGMIVGKAYRKVYTVSDNVAITISGSVSDVQLLTKYVRAEIKLKELQTGRKIFVKEVANMLSGWVYQSVRGMTPGIAHLLIGGRDSKGIHLYDLFPDGSLTEITDYFSSGSGSVFALGVLEAQYNKDMDESAAVELAQKAITSALKRDVASGNGIDVLVIPNQGEMKQIPKEVSL